MTLKPFVRSAAALPLALLIAGAGATATLAQSERLPGGVERAPDAPGAAGASDALKPQNAPKMGTTRGLTSPKPSAPIAPAPAAAPPPPASTDGAKAPAAPSASGEKK